jgi:4-amino-4-deoxy-L-arabinose transferase-like glycosyltransferase
MERAKVKTDLLILLLISGCVLLFNLGTGSLTSWDEGVHAEVAREMLDSGNLIDLSWAGERWSDKPPLYMWMITFFYKIFGINEFSVRFFSALCGIGTVIVTYLFANKLYSRRVAISAALILLSTQHFIWSAKVGMLDATLTFFIAFSLFLFRLGEEKRIYFFFSLIAFTCAFLTKGGGALIIPIILAVYLISSSKMRMLKEPALILGILFSLVILGWWHYLAFSHYGEKFISGYFIKHLFTRTTKAVEGHVGSVFTYFKVLPNKGRPWAAFAFLTLPFVIYRIFIKKEKEHLLPAIWVFSVLLIFSLVKTKLHWYIVPIYPALSILLAWGINKIFKKFTVVMVGVLASISLLYLSLAKGIFNLDYSPETKRIALAVKKVLPVGESIFIYEVGDPGIRFYLGDVGKHISGLTGLQETLKEKNRYILLENERFADLSKSNLLIIIQNSDFVVVRTR